MTCTSRSGNRKDAFWKGQRGGRVHQGRQGGPIAGTGGARGSPEMVEGHKGSGLVDDHEARDDAHR